MLAQNPKPDRSQNHAVNGGHFTNPTRVLGTCHI